MDNLLTAAADEHRVDWRNHGSTHSNYRKKQRETGQHADVRLCIGGTSKTFLAHKSVLCACSDFFESTLDSIPDYQNPVVIVLNEITEDELEALLDFMYLGSCRLSGLEIEKFLKTGRDLRIKGLLTTDDHPNLLERFQPHQPVKQQPLVDVQPNPYIMNNLTHAVAVDYMNKQFNSSGIERLLTNAAVAANLVAAATSPPPSFVQPLPPISSACIPTTSSALPLSNRTPSPAPKKRRYSNSPINSKKKVGKSNNQDKPVAHPLITDIPVVDSFNHLTTTEPLIKQEFILPTDVATAPADIVSESQIVTKNELLEPTIDSCSNEASSSSVPTVNNTTSSSSSVQEFLNAEMSVATQEQSYNSTRNFTVATDSDSDDDCGVEPRLLINVDEPQEEQDDHLKMEQQHSVPCDVLQPLALVQQPQPQGLIKTDEIGENKEGIVEEVEPEGELSKAEQKAKKKKERQEHLMKHQKINWLVGADGKKYRQFQCRTCNAILANGNLLKRHIFDKHDGIRKYKCPYCHRPFKRKEHMERHIRTHTGEKPYECCVCGQKFTQKEHMKGHKKNTHDKKLNKVIASRRPPRKIAAKGKNKKVPSTYPHGALNGHNDQIVLNEGIQNNVTDNNASLLPVESSPLNLVDLTNIMKHGNFRTNLSLLANAATVSQLSHLSLNGSDDGSQMGSSNEDSSRSPPSLTSPSGLSYPPTTSTPAYFSHANLVNLFTPPPIQNAQTSMPALFPPTSTSPNTNSLFHTATTTTTPNLLFPPSSTSPNPLITSLLAASSQSFFTTPSLSLDPTPLTSSTVGGRPATKGKSTKGRKPRATYNRKGQVATPPQPPPPTSSAPLASLIVIAPKTDDNNASADAGPPQMTAVYAPVTRSNVNSPQKHMKEVLLNIPSEV